MPHENYCLSAAWNYTLDRTHDDYIALLSSDDWLEETVLEQFVLIAETTGEAIVAYRFFQKYADKTVELGEVDIEFIVKVRISSAPSEWL